MSIKILLADDSITIQKVIGIIFGGNEYLLTVVDNGAAAVEKAREILPDIMLVDVHMPGMSGYEVCEAVRVIPALAAKPVMLMAGSFEPFDEEKAQKCGADDFIVKPFESQLVISKVKELLDMAAARVTPQPATEAMPVTTQPTTPASIDPLDDIWGAFTSHDISTPDPAPAAAAFTAINTFESDVFSMVNEETVVTSAETGAETPTFDLVETALGWNLDEDTFEMDTIVTPTEEIQDTDSPFNESAFDFSYKEINVKPVEPPAHAVVQPMAAEFNVEVPIPVEVPLAAAPTTIATAQPIATLTEEQLRQAIAGVSKEVIERIVWEIVPDLAETLIKEAIRKIREGH